MEFEIVQKNNSPRSASNLKIILHQKYSFHKNYGYRKTFKKLKKGKTFFKIFEKYQKDKTGWNLDILIGNFRLAT